MKENDVGVFQGIPNGEYHAGPGISKSGLDLIACSPLHYRFKTTTANDNPPTPAQRVGTITHTAILEPHLFWQHYAEPFEAPDGALATTDEIKDQLRALGEKVSGNKPELIERLRFADPGAVFLDDLKAEYAAANEGREIVDRDTLALVAGMRDAVMAHPAASGLLTAVPGWAELSAYWRDPITGVLCRCRPDWWRSDGILVDLKTTDDASPEGFAKSLLDWRYHVQAPFYLDGCRLALEQADGITLDVPAPAHFIFIVVEKKPPHAVAVYKLDAQSMELGRIEYARDVATCADCLRSDTWPGYGDKVQPISLPEWHLRKSALAGAQ